MSKILDVKNLTVKVNSEKKELKIIDDISLSLNSGETVGIIGESGCGKSITALSILRLLEPNIKITDGIIEIENTNVRKLSAKELRKICGKKVGMVFQEPMTALNPVFNIEQQMLAPMKTHLKISKHELHNRCIKLLQQVGIKEPEAVLKSYPHQLSGGMRQRIVIAMAISCSPSLLIADEPTTALDVTLQLQILRIIKNLVQQNKMSLLIISHDIGVISTLAEEIIVMYAGEIIEQDSKENILKNAQHPYSEKLITTALELQNGSKQLTIVEGSVPRPYENIVGCKFAPRCEFCTEKCLNEKPPVIQKSNGIGKVKCWKYVKD